MSKIRALMIEDNAFDRRRLKRIAADTDLDFVFVESRTIEEFKDRLDTERFDVIYVDLNLAGEDGMTLLPMVRKHPKNAMVPMIMVAGNEQAEAALRALRAGFADYIEKNALSPAALSRATINALQKAKLVSAANVAESETKSVEDVLNSFAQACSNEMRPMLARMFRQVRQMRLEVESNGVDASALLEIEQTCTRMGEFFQDLGGLATEGLLTSIAESDAPVAANSKV
ncbi:MAG: response regulator [Pseudomonadota bacterium]